MVLQNTAVVSVLTNVLYCRKNNIRYDGEGSYASVGRPPIIEVQSVEAEIIADTIENGNSSKMLTYIVNQYRKANDLPSLTLSAVHGCFLRLASMIKLIRRGKQGRKVEKDVWCRASFCWFAQLLLRFGKIMFHHPMFKELLGSEKYDVDNPPSCYDYIIIIKSNLISRSKLT